MLNILISVIALYILLYLFFKSYRDYQVDVFRQNLFDLRDELFDDASKGKISFESESYILLRTILNGMIRYAHKMDTWTFIFDVFDPKTNIRTKDNHVRSLYNQSYKKLNEQQKNLVDDYHKRISNTLVKYITYGTPTALAIIPLLILVVIAIAVIAVKMNPRIRQNAEDSLTEKAYIHGMDDFHMAA